MCRFSKISKKQYYLQNPMLCSWYGRGGAAHVRSTWEEHVQPLPVRHQAGDLPQVQEPAQPLLETFLRYRNQPNLCWRPSSGTGTCPASPPSSSSWRPFSGTGTCPTSARDLPQVQEPTQPLLETFLRYRNLPNLCWRSSAGAV